MPRLSSPAHIAAVATVLAVSTTLPGWAADAPGPLVDAHWAIENGANENVVILDIRTNVDGTDLGDAPYLANAVVAPYDTAGWRTEIDGIPGKIPSVEDLAALIQSLGIDNDDHVVIVPWGTDSSEFGSATRVYWTFRYLGHDQVSILDGGWRQYDAQGGARVAEPVTAEASTFTIMLNETLLATTDEVVVALESGVALVDGRPEDQYRGETKSQVAAAAGTIPGSVNLPHHQFYSAEYASFALAETLEALTAAVGLAPDQQNITFCNTGHWASVAWFGISEILGNQNTAMYDGSMAEWTLDASRPLDPARVN